MAFNSVLFVFFFAPTVILINAALPTRLSNVFLLLASVAFYAWGEPLFVGIVLLSALVDYALGALIDRRIPRRLRRLLLAAGVFGNIGLLVYCKYLNFFVDSVGAVLGDLGLPFVDILLPLGISFIVFEKITYLVDVYRGTTPKASGLVEYLTFVFFFPKMLAGPIIKYHEIRDQLAARRTSLDDMEQGAARFLVGLAKKVLIADQLAMISDQVFAAPSAQVGFADAWLGALCFAMQIYFDFSGYSDMAIGLARMMGIRLPENFRQPYLAVGFSDFWSRWHISLSTWIRDYLYIPLGGNRVSAPRMHLNLWVCFLASGLWHGASWTFIAWGAFHGLFVSLDRTAFGEWLRRLPRLPGVLITFVLVVFGWVLFRAESFSQAGHLMLAMLSPVRATTVNNIWIGPDAHIVLIAGLFISFVPIRLVQALWSRVPPWRVFVGHAAILAVSIWAFGHLFTMNFTPFLYFRF